MVEVIKPHNRTLKIFRNKGLRRSLTVMLNKEAQYTNQLFWCRVCLEFMIVIGKRIKTF